MIIAVVEIPPNGKMKDRAATVAQARESASKIYRDVEGLVRKHYLTSENGGGGIYFFENREKAEAWFHDGWADWMEGRFGVRPTLRLYENYLTLDNAAGEIFVDGKPTASRPEAAE